jgi:hypothetical protein
VFVWCGACNSEKMGRTMKIVEGIFEWRRHLTQAALLEQRLVRAGVRNCLSIATAIFITCCFTSLAQAVSISVSPNPLVFPDTFVGSSSSVETFTATVQDLSPSTIFNWSLPLTGGDFSDPVFELNCVTGIQNPCTVDYTFTPQSAGLHNQILAISAKFIDGSFVTSTDISLTGTGIAATPLPAALPLFATGLGALGLLGWRRKRKNAAAIAA